MNLSINIRSSPKELKASALLKRNPSLTSSSLNATRIPLPPPPADALIMTGYPTSFANTAAWSSSRTSPSKPGITNQSASFATFLE